MTPLELRILTSAVTAPAPLGYYLGEMLTLLGDLGGVPEPVIRTRFVAAIGRLFRQQYLVAERIDNDGMATGEYFYPASAKIEAGLRREICFDYQLTPQGSSFWEEQAQPNWSHYICNSWTHGDKLQQCTLAGMQETLVKIGVLLDSP